KNAQIPTRGCHYHTEGYNHQLEKVTATLRSDQTVKVLAFY
ncbi:MAG: hypothetical protein ACI9GZ_001009, partial [Bacteroidia bacterium]